jgi:polar amino acid transport system substrate-binding protein
MFFKTCLLLVYILLLLLSSNVVDARNKADLLVVATENPLLQYTEKGQFKGPSIEILKALLTESKLTADIQLMPWARAFSLAKKERNTLILSIIRTPVRENQFHWIGKVSELALVFISLSDKPENKVSNDQQAKNKKIAIIRDSNGHKELVTRGFEVGKNLYLVATLEQMFTLFINNRVDLVYVDPNMIEKFIQEKKLKNVGINFNPITSHHHRESYIAASKNTDIKLLNKLKRAMEKIKQTEKYAELVAR